MRPYEQILAKLKDHDIEYQEFNHEPVYTSEDAAKVRGLSLDEGAKSLLLKTKGKFILVVLSGSKRLDSKKLKKQLGTKELRFATPSEVQSNMFCIIGACYPFGSLNSLDTYLDESLSQLSHLSFNPGMHDKSIRIRLEDYQKMEKPIKVAVAA